MTDENSNRWLVYIIRADDNSLYTGITTDLARRWQQHAALQRGGAKFFRGRKPLALVYVEACHDRSTATRREVAIKRLARSAKELLLTAASNGLASFEYLLSEINKKS
jgi:putative endonuclease